MLLCCQVPAACRSGAFRSRFQPRRTCANYSSAAARQHHVQHCRGGSDRSSNLQDDSADDTVLSRRSSLKLGVTLLLSASCIASAGAAAVAAEEATILKKYTPMDALKGKDYGKPRLRYPDFVTTESGLQYKDLRDGTGAQPQEGDTVVMDWDGYTIGYYGRPFEARNKPKGSSFSGDNKDFYRFVLGSHSVIPAVEEAVASMREGGIRRIIVPEELGYPEGGWSVQGPKPSTFAGERALGFVLGNKGMIDKTLLFDIELVRIGK